MPRTMDWEASPDTSFEKDEDAEILSLAGS